MKLVLRLRCRASCLDISQLIELPLLVSSLQVMVPHLTRRRMCLVSLMLFEPLDELYQLNQSLHRLKECALIVLGVILRCLLQALSVHGLSSQVVRSTLLEFLLPHRNQLSLLYGSSSHLSRLLLKYPQ